MSSARLSEVRFVERFIRPQEKEWYRSSLDGNKHLQRVLDRVNSGLDLDPTYTHEVPTHLRDKDRFIELLNTLYLSSTCYVLADVFGRHELRLERALELLFSHEWEVLLMLLGKPIALYKAGRSEQILWLSRTLPPWLSS